MSSLYEILGCMSSIDWFDEETGEVDLEKKKEFDELKVSFDTKAENIIKFIKNLEADAEKIKNEEQNLAERRKRKENKAKALKQYLGEMMTLAGREKLDYVSGEASFRKSKSVEVDDEFINWAKNNQDELLIYKEPTVNKTAIKEAIKGGKEFEFARIVENNNLNIK